MADDADIITDATEAFSEYVVKEVIFTAEEVRGLKLPGAGPFQAKVFTLIRQDLYAGNTLVGYLEDSTYTAFVAPDSSGILRMYETYKTFATSRNTKLTFQGRRIGPRVRIDAQTLNGGFIGQWVPIEHVDWDCETVRLEQPVPIAMRRELDPAYYDDLTFAQQTCEDGQVRFC